MLEPPLLLLARAEFPLRPPPPLPKEPPRELAPEETLRFPTLLAPPPALGRVAGFVLGLEALPPPGRVLAPPPPGRAPAAPPPGRAPAPPPPGRVPAPPPPGRVPAPAPAPLPPWPRAVPPYLFAVCLFP